VQADPSRFGQGHVAGVAEFPPNIECEVRKSVRLGGHSFFFGEIMAVHCDRLILSTQGTIDKAKLGPLCAFLDSYWSLGEPVLKFGSAKKPPKWKQAERLPRD